MKNKILVDIFVPNLIETYNIFLPVNKTVGEVIYLLNKTINKQTNNEFPLSNQLSLINMTTGVIYNNDKTIKDNKILNGDRLVLV